jgi:hypothetical protein
MRGGGGGMIRGGGGGGGGMMGHGGFRGPGPVVGTSGRGPFIHGGSGPFMPNGAVRGGGFDHNGGVVRGGNFVHGGNFVRGGAWNGHGFVGPTHFFRPYYAFHPRVSLGFGLWAGYPFAYPYAYYNPFYSYPYYSPYPYYPYGYSSLDSDDNATIYPDTSGSVDVQEPNQTNMGGLSFDITPGTAELFVDNMRIGTVGQFTPTTQPLGLEAGHHHIEVRADGYHELSFDVDIVAGQVIPYQGSLER